MKIRIKKLDERAITPTYGTEYSAGADLYALLDEAVDLIAPWIVQALDVIDVAAYLVSEGTGYGHVDDVLIVRKI